MEEIPRRSVRGQAVEARSEIGAGKAQHVKAGRDDASHDVMKEIRLVEFWCFGCGTCDECRIEGPRLRSFCSTYESWALEAFLVFLVLEKVSALSMIEK